MTTIEGTVAAITGAASGIGRELAIALTTRGAEVALSDLDGDGLAETAKLCGATHRVSTTIVDVADRDRVFSWADEVVNEYGRVNLVFNNAGVNLNHRAATQRLEDVEWVMDIDFWGVVYGTQAFLPHLERATTGHLVNISSVFGLVSIPSQSAYNAAKFGVRGYSDALAMELALDGSSVRVTTVHPGGIKTNIARNGRSDDIAKSSADFDRLALTGPDKAALQILRAVERNRRRALIGPDAVLFDAVSRLPAAISQRIVIAVSKRHVGSRNGVRDALEQ